MASASKDVFDFISYKSFVNYWITQQLKKGYGLYRKISIHLNVSTVIVSQIFKGPRELSPEQAFKLSEFLQLTEIEREYFLMLVQIARSGESSFTDFLFSQLKDIRNRSLKLKNRVGRTTALTEIDEARFHSGWAYSAIRLASSIEKFDTPKAMSERLNLPLAQVQNKLEFLVSCGLCIREGTRYKMGPRRTHLADESPFIVGRQMSWRSKAAERMPKMTEAELFYTAPMSIAKSDIEKVRKEILRLIDSVNKIVEPSDAEELTCLNIDWFIL